MEHDIVYYHKQLQKYIRVIEHNETDQDALEAVKETFLIVFDMIKMVMISKQERYYGVFLMNFDLCIDFSLYYEAAVNIDSFPFRMLVNPLLIGKHSLPEMIYILCHEIEHIVLNHPVDGIKYNPHKDSAIGYKLNIAMDASINDRLTVDSEVNKFNVIVQPEEAITSAYLSEHFKLHVKQLQAFDYYYERLPTPRACGERIKIIFVDEIKKNQIITDSKRKNVVCLHSWTTNDDPEEVKSIIQSFISDILKGMSDHMRSNLPDCQKEALEALIAAPSIMWKQLLKRYVGTIPDGHKKTRTRLSRRQPERYDISGTIKDRIIKLVVAIDTSGSMEIDTLERIMIEIFDIIGSRLCELTIVECDAEIQRVYKARSIKDISYDIQGRGGTSFIPVIEFVNSSRYFRDAILIYFTDGRGDRSIPRPLTLRTMWVLHSDECDLSVRNPYGEVLVME